MLSGNNGGSDIVDWLQTFDGATKRATVTAFARIGGGWLVALRFEDQGGTVDLVDLHFFAEGRETYVGPVFPPPLTPITTAGVNDLQLDTPLPAGGLTTALLRGVNVGQLQQEARARLRRDQSLTFFLPDDFGEAATRRPGRRGRSDSEYAAVAAEYVRLLDDGVAKPVDQIAKALYINASTVRSMLNKARLRGLLTDAPPGKAGGELTAKARKLLELKEN